MATLTCNNHVIWGEWSTQCDINVRYNHYDNRCDHIWNQWTNTTVYYAGTSTDATWYTWNTDYVNYGTTVTVSNSNAVWDIWISDEDVVTNPDIQHIVDRLQITPSQKYKIKTKSVEKIRAKKAQREIQHVWNRLIAEEREAEVRLAEATAEELLFELIGESEMARYKATGQLFVKGNKFDYLIRKHGGVHRLEKDKIIDFVKKKEARGKYICIHPKKSYNYPETDNVISLKLWIENNENEFLKIGNLHSGEERIENFDRIVAL